METFANLSKKKIIIGALFILVLVAIPVTYFLSQQQQDLRQRASETQVCEDSPADIVLAIDRSPSMLEENKFTEAKSAANSFIDKASKDSENRIALVAYSNPRNTEIESNFTNNFNSLKSKVSSLRTSGGTCISCAVKKINNAISSGNRQGMKNVAILLTDGQANQILSTYPSRTVSPKVAEEEALKFVKEGFNKNNTVFFTIGVGNQGSTNPIDGSGVNDAFLQKIASETGGKYYYAPSGNDLTQIYQEISQITGKGIISGFVYDDTNNNGQFDNNEQKLSGWEITVNREGNKVDTVTTDGNGSYTFTGLCDGEFETSVELQDGWTPTNPQNGKREVTISQGSVATNTNFGVTLNSEETFVTVQAQLPGIGTATGDNTDPVHPIRTAQVEIYNLQNEKIKEGTGSAEFNGQDTYVGKIPLGTGFSSGSYYAKIRFHNTLRTTVDGVHPINAGEENVFPITELTPGDLDQNNILDIRDYNIFLTCYGEKKCDEVYESRADHNDSGEVGPKDYNILLRAFSIRPGSGATITPSPTPEPTATTTPTPSSTITPTATPSVTLSPSPSASPTP